MNLRTVKQEIAKGEDSGRQFKRDVTNDDSLATEMAAFAHADGGSIFLGVADDGKIVGLTVKAPIHAVDWFPTLAHLAGGAVPISGLGAGESDRRLFLPLDGINIWPVLTEGKPTPHKSILIQTSPLVGTLRMGDWKLVVHHGVKDPGEIGTGTVASNSVKLFSLALAPKVRPKPRGFVTPKVWGAK